MTLDEWNVDICNRARLVIRWRHLHHSFNEKGRAISDSAFNIFDDEWFYFFGITLPLW
jgi:hypothetical protein